MILIVLIVWSIIVGIVMNLCLSSPRNISPFVPYILGGIVAWVAAFVAYKDSQVAFVAFALYSAKVGLTLFILLLITVRIERKLYKKL